MTNQTTPSTPSASKIASDLSAAEVAALEGLDHWTGGEHTYETLFNLRQKDLITYGDDDIGSDVLTDLGRDVLAAATSAPPAAGGKPEAVTSQMTIFNFIRDGYLKPFEDGKLTVYVAGFRERGEVEVIDQSIVRLGFTDPTYTGDYRTETVLAVVSKPEANQPADNGQAAGAGDAEDDDVHIVNALIGSKDLPYHWIESHRARINDHNRRLVENDVLDLADLAEALKVENEDFRSKLAAAESQNARLLDEISLLRSRLTTAQEEWVNDIISKAKGDTP